MKSLANKKILITGAAGGLGQEYTRQLMELGSHLILTDLNEPALRKIADGVTASLSNAPGKILGVFESNLATKEGCEAAYRKCAEIDPMLDVLINNAGIITYGDFHEVPMDKWETLMNLNLLAPMHLTYKFLPGMVERKEGHIVFMSSVAGIVATSQGTPYTCSKFALRGFGMALYGELKKKGVDVTNIYPFWVQTPLLNSPSYGNTPIKKLPSIFADNPQKVIKEAICGIRKRKLHVYPGIYSKAVNFAAKFVPIVSSQAH